jgi:hypothetical protein
MNGHWQDAEKATLLTRPAPARRDAPFRELRSRFVEILNVLIEILGGGSAGGVFPFAKIHYTGERPHEVRSVPPPVSTHLQPCWTAFLSILLELDDFLCSCNVRSGRSILRLQEDLLSSLNCYRK